MNDEGSRNHESRLAHREIAISLNKFTYLHSQLERVNNDEYDNLFIGRNELKEKLVGILGETSKGRGSYLIAGYRGAGKTSLINRVIDDYKSKCKSEKKGDKKKNCKGVLTISINLGNKERLSPQSIFYSIANILKDELIEEKKFVNFILKNRPSYWLYLLLLVVIPPVGAALYFWRGVLQWDTLLNIAMLLPLMLTISIPVVISLNWRMLGIYDRISDLILRMENEITDSDSLEIKNNYVKANKTKSIKSLPLTAREVEYNLNKIIKDLNDNGIFTIFVFDEIDKLSEREISDADKSDKTHQINNLLAAVKNFITTTRARFFFIAGRETLDSYHSERDSANSLYESLFDQVYEVPSLLTDGSQKRGDKASISFNVEKYICRRLAPKLKYKDLIDLYKDQIENRTDDGAEVEINARLSVLVLRNLTHYLCFHSWGNPKRLSSIFESFIRPIESDDNSIKINFLTDNDSNCLYFTFNQQRSLSFCSNLFVLFQHQLSREVSTIGDKLTVSALSSLQFILKFHQYAFTRESLHRMSEALNSNRDPQLNVIVDDLLSHVFKPYVRRVRNGAYRYRFLSGFEQELRYVSYIGELESASFNFSLDAMRRVKQHFEGDFKSDKNCNIVRSKSAITLGDMCAIEQSYTDAAKYFSAAIHFISLELDDADSWINNIDLKINYLEAIIKYGDLEEHRQNYNKSAILYAQANDFLGKVVFKGMNKNEHKIVRSGDSKWDILKQAYWAGIFLSLKRSPAKNISKTYCPRICNALFDCNNDPRYHLRLASYLFFNGTHNRKQDDAASDNFHQNYTAWDSFYEAYRLTRSKDDKELKNDTERDCFINSSAVAGLADSALIHRSFEMLNELANKEREKNKDNATGEIEGKIEIEGEGRGTVQAKESLITLLEKTSNLLNSPVSIETDRDTSDTIEKNIFEKLVESAKIFEKHNLYINALIIYLKLIAYRLTMLDVYSNSKSMKEYLNIEETNGDDKNRTIDEYFKEINGYAKPAVKCIKFARQLDSSHSIKTMIIRDYTRLEKYQSDDDLLTQLFDLFIHNDDEFSNDGEYPKTQEAFWQHSLWGQKLVSLLYWAEYIKSKLKDDYQNRILPGGSTAPHFEPSKYPTLSIRSSIMMRWIYARALIRNNFYKNKAENTFVFKGEELLDSLPAIKPCGEQPNLWILAYQASRNLYFTLRDISLISRKNTDLIYPSLSHIYHIQWQLLKNIADSIINNEKSIEGYDPGSFRSVCRFIQQQFRIIDDRCGGNEKITPSHFDYEFIYSRLITNLDEVITIHDNTSRVRTSILQHKYFFHDDHSDQEFRIDWTLSHLFSPAAYCLKESAIQTHQKLHVDMAKKNALK